MRFALVWLSATITAVIAAERTHKSTYNQSTPFAPFKLICAGEGGKRRRGGKQHPRAQVSRKLLLKGREDVIGARSDIYGLYRLNKGVVQKQAKKKDVEAWASTSAAPEHHRVFDRPGQYQRSDAHSGPRSVQHGQLRLGYDDPFLKNLHSSADLFRNAGKHSSMYSPDIEHIRKNWQDKPTMSIARERTPREQPEYSEAELDRMQALRDHQRLHADKLQNEMAFQEIRGSGSRQHQKSIPHTSEMEALSNYEAYSGQRHSHPETNDMIRAKRAEYTVRSAVQPVPELHTLADAQSQVKGRNQLKNLHPHQQQQREAHNRNTLHTMQDGNPFALNQGQRAENILGFSVGYESPPKQDRLPPVRFSLPFSDGRDVHRDSSTSGTLSSRQKSTTGRKKPTATKENFSGTIGLHKEKRAERRSYRRGDSLTAAASAVAPRIRGRNALSDGETGRPLPKSVPVSALSLTDYEVDVTEELPLMAKSVLDLGIADVQMLADALYALKSAHYAQRLEEASKQRKVQEGMFFTKLNRIQERQKRQRRESELRDEERLKSLEQSLRLTKPLNTYYDTVSEETAQRRKRKSVSENRLHKDSDLKGWNRTTGEVSLGREVKLSRRSPKKEGHWWERRQKQKVALALIESEEHGDEASGRASRYRRHSRRGAEEKDTDDVAFFDIEKGDQGHEARTIFSTWEDLSTTPDGKGNLLFLAEEDDLLVSSQTEVKRDVKPARTGHRGENSLNKGGKEIKEATEEAGGSIRPFNRPKFPAGEGQQRGVDTHLEALSRPAIAPHKNYKSAGKAESAAYPEGLTQGQGQAGQRTRQELDTSSLFPAHGDKTLSKALQIDTAFSPPNVEVAVSEEEMATEAEILSALIGGDGTEKLLAEKVPENALHVYQTNRVRKPAGLGGMLRKGPTDATEGMHREHKDSEDEMVEGGSVGAEADLSALHESHAPTLPPDGKSTNIVRPTSQENNMMEQEAEEKTNVVRPSSHKEDMLEQEAGVAKGEETDSLEDKQALADESIKRPETQSLTSIIYESAEETIVQSSTAAAFQSGELTGEAGTLEEEAAEAPVEGEAGSETSSRSVAVAAGSHQPTGVPEEDVALEESGLEHVFPETLKIDTADSSPIQPRLRESPSRSDHRLDDPFTFLDTSQDVTEEETSHGEGFLKKGSFREEVTLDDTFALRLSESSPPEVQKNDKKPAAFNRPYEYTTGTTYSSPLEILPISPSRLNRFRARHFRGDTSGRSEFAGERPDRFTDRSPEIRHGDKVKLAIPVVQELRALPYYRRLQFTSKKRTVLDRSTPARFEFVDNDHGMQFVNWRSIDGERMIEKFWVNSMEEAERQQRRQVQREIESAFAKELDAVRRKKQISHALGLSTAEDDESEQQLAQRYYIAMQAVLHGPEEEVLTGQAFGRYVPSINRSFLTDIRNRIIYGPWSVNWNRAITSRTQRVSVGSRRGAISVGSSASSYVTTTNVNWGRTAVTFSARPNDQAVKLGVLRGRYGVDIARSNRLRTSAVETVMRYVESATVVDQINRTYGQRVRVRRFSFNYTRDFTLPSFDSPGRTPGLRQELGVNWGTVGISVGTDVPDSEYAVSVGLRGYQFSVLRDFFQRLVQAQGNWGRGWQFELATKVEDPISPLIYYQFGFGRLGRLYTTVGAGIGGDNTPMALFQVQGDRTSVVFKAVEYAGVRAFNVGITVGRFTYSWDSVVTYDQITLPLSPISPILKALLHVTP